MAKEIRGVSETRTFGTEFEIVILGDAADDETTRYERSAWGLYEWLEVNNIDVGTPCGYHGSCGVSGWK